MLLLKIRRIVLISGKINGILILIPGIMVKALQRSVFGALAIVCTMETARLMIQIVTIPNPSSIAMNMALVIMLPGQHFAITNMVYRLIAADININLSTRFPKMLTDMRGYSFAIVPAPQKEIFCCLL